MNMISIVILPVGKLYQHELKQFIRVNNESWCPSDGSVDVFGLEAWRSKYWSPDQH